MQNTQLQETNVVLSVNFLIKCPMGKDARVLEDVQISNTLSQCRFFP